MKIIGHQKIINLLDKSIEKNAVSQAYLFSGPEGVGKFTVAMDFAQKLAGNSLSVNSDLIVLKPEIEKTKVVIKKHDIKIEQIRELQHQLSLSAQSGKYKVAIIDEADRLNRTAQNGLLKTLEDAQPRTVIILVSSAEKKLLPTILSRCQKIRFGTVSEVELRANMQNVGEEERGRILFWSLGRPGLMLDIIQNKSSLDFREETFSELEELFAKNAVEKFTFAEELSKDISLLLRKMDIWLFLLRESLLGRNNFGKINQAKTLKLIDRTISSMETLKDTNANARLVLENLFLNF